MKQLCALALVLVLVGFQSAAHASAGLTIHAAEIGVGKFHRYDHAAHAYGNENVWKAYIAPAGALQTPVVTQNSDQSYSILFSTLEELFTSSIALAQQTGLKISVLNINAHGLPGAMWFPKDAAEMKGAGCRDWLKSANAPDQENYSQYYSAVSKSDIMAIRQFADMPDSPFIKQPCTVGTDAWKEKVAKLPAVKTSFASDAQIHFLSCVVGLGSRGAAFTREIASLMLTGDQAVVRSSLNFGLGDWSMPEGMSFWDYQSDAQLQRDNAGYPVNRRDRDIMQRGSMRVASKAAGVWQVGVVNDVQFMLLGWNALSPMVLDEVVPRATTPIGPMGKMPSRIRIPGTTTYIDLGQ